MSPVDGRDGLEAGGSGDLGHRIACDKSTTARYNSNIHNI
jgi:hypothetical protein